MEISDIIRRQAFGCLVMLGDGVLLTVLFTAGSLIKRKLRPGKVVSTFLELFFWNGAAIITGEFLYYCDYGQWTFHSAGALLIGIVFSKKFIYDRKYDIIYPNVIY